MQENAYIYNKHMLYEKCAFMGSAQPYAVRTWLCQGRILHDKIFLKQLCWFPGWSAGKNNPDLIQPLMAFCYQHQSAIGAPCLDMRKMAPASCTFSLNLHFWSSSFQLLAMQFEIHTPLVKYLPQAFHRGSVIFKWIGMLSYSNWTSYHLLSNILVQSITRTVWTNFH